MLTAFASLKCSKKCLNNVQKPRSGRSYGKQALRVDVSKCRPEAAQQVEIYAKLKFV